MLLLLLLLLLFVGVAGSDELLEALASEVAADELLLAERMDAPVVALAVGAATGLDEALVEAEVVTHAVAPRLVHVLGEVGVLLLHEVVDLVQLHHLRLAREDGVGDDLQVGLGRL